MSARASAGLCAIFVLVHGLCGCEARLTLGQGCVRASECAEPLACLVGRCRNECEDDRDCAAGLRCVRDRDGFGACTLPDEEACASASCAPPLRCVDGECRNDCDTDADCTTSGWCAAGSCATRLAEITRCDDSSDCPTGWRCHGTDVRVCAEVCAAHEVCEPGIGCQDLLDAVSGEPFYGCGVACRPGTSEGCPAGSTCSMVAYTSSLPGGPAARTVCRSIGTSVEGCFCSDGGFGIECAAAMSCDRTAAPGYACARICTLGSDCAPGVPCGAFEVPLTRDGVSYGVCPVAATRPTTGCSLPP